MRQLALASLFVCVAANAGAQQCVDPRLSEAAASLLVADASATEASLVEAARVAGSNAVSLRLVRARQSDAALEELLAFGREGEGGLFVCGEAESEGTIVRIVGRQGAKLSAPLTSRGAVIDVELDPSSGRAALEVRALDGTAFRRDLRGLRSRVPLPDGFPRAFVAQIVAESALGPRPVAVLATAPAALSSDIAEDVDAFVSTTRSRAGVAALRRNTILARVAAAHAAEICREGRASHHGEAGDPVQRVARAGLDARAVGEVVSRAEELVAALRGFDTSASHRLELEAAEYTDYGAAIARAEDGHVCVVVELAAWPRFNGR